MSDLVERLISKSTDGHADEEALYREAAVRIEALEAALREVIDGYDWTMTNCSNVVMPSVFHALIPKARAALAEEQDK